MIEDKTEKSKKKFRGYMSEEQLKKLPKKKRTLPQSSGLTGAIITPEGTVNITSVMADLQLTQQKLGDKIGGIPQATIASWITGKRAVHPKACEALYGALDKDKRVEFLYFYSRGEPKQMYVPYITTRAMLKQGVGFYSGISPFISDTMMHSYQSLVKELICEEEKWLRPLYSSFVKAYCSIFDSNKRAQMRSDLERLIEGYKAQSQVRETTSPASSDSSYSDVSSGSSIPQPPALPSG